ncbi:hypothetical protein L7F22_051150 [Adiantum nelumboides]|nr:hypothetical protein [Adiantum nelumboides]
MASGEGQSNPSTFGDAGRDHHEDFGNEYGPPLPTQEELREMKHRRLVGEATNLMLNFAKDPKLAKYMSETAFQDVQAQLKATTTSPSKPDSKKQYSEKELEAEIDARLARILGAQKQGKKHDRKRKKSTDFNGYLDSVVLDLLKSYISDQKTQWERYLPLVEFAYNNTIHSSTGKAPFEIVKGAMKVPPFFSTKEKILEANEYTRDLDTAFAKINDISFRLRLPDTWKIHNVFHVNLWKTFGDVPDDGELDEQPEVEENEEILVPEQVLAHKVTKKGKARRQFLIKFKNFPAFDAKWMEEEDLADTPQILKLYLEAFGIA